MTDRQGEELRPTAPRSQDALAGVGAGGPPAAAWPAGDRRSSAVLFEACVDSSESALAAAAGGADRVELCTALTEGGLTPSDGMVALVRRQLDLPIHVLLRPRGGDFLYSEAEFAVMQLDLERLREQGVDGVVLGLLLPDGRVDRERTAVLVAQARPMRVTFHRALDMTRDPEEALDDLIDLGIERVLTSGQEATALAGAATIAALVRQAADRIAVMAGAGINAANIAEVVARTGVREVHATARATRDSVMAYRNPRCPMGGTPLTGEYTLAATNVASVRALVTAARRDPPCPG